MAVVVALVPSGMASAADLSIPLDTVIDAGVSQGDEAALETVATGALEGATCELRSVRGDRTVTHPGNALVIESGGVRRTLEDVEGPEEVVEGPSITLGPTVSVTLKMGVDEQFAAGITVELDCDVTAVTTLAAQDDQSAADGATSTAATTDAAAADALTDLPDTGSGATVASLLLAVACLSIGAALVLVARRPATP